jgi:hypothetical protein
MSRPISTSTTGRNQLDRMARKDLMVRHRYEMMQRCEGKGKPGMAQSKRIMQRNACPEVNQERTLASRRCDCSNPSQELRTKVVFDANMEPKMVPVVCGLPVRGCEKKVDSYMGPGDGARSSQPDLKTAVKHKSQLLSPEEASHPSWSAKRLEKQKLSLSCPEGVRLVFSNDGHPQVVDPRHTSCTKQQKERKGQLPGRLHHIRVTAQDRTKPSAPAPASQTSLGSCQLSRVYEGASGDAAGQLRRQHARAHQPQRARINCQRMLRLQARMIGLEGLCAQEKTPGCRKHGEFHREGTEDEREIARLHGKQVTGGCGHRKQVIQIQQDSGESKIRVLRSTSKVSKGCGGDDKQTSNRHHVELVALQEPVHPSWTAAKVKQKQAVQGVRELMSKPVAKKVVFD